MEQVVPFQRWSSPTKATPDCFNRCSPLAAGRLDDAVAVPQNFAGYQQPYEGVGYAGIGFDTPDYGEYLQTLLSAPLKKDSVYHIAFRVSRADHSPTGSPGLGACFTERSLGNAGSAYGPLHNVPQFRVDTAVMDTSNWVLVAGDIKAKGGERYLTIGFFQAGLRIPTKRAVIKSHGITGTYCYVDDVHLTPKHRGTRPAITTVAREEPVTWTVRDVLFDIDKAELKPEGVQFLDSLRTAVLDGSKGNIRIDGHTDNTGTDAHNTGLSLRRAEAVADHLAQGGITRTRLVTRGLGSSLPIADNSTRAGKSRNRRVVITLLH